MSGTGSLPDDPGERLHELLREQGLGDPAAPEAEPEPLDETERIIQDSRPDAPDENAEAGAEQDPADGDGEDAGDSLPDAPLFALLRTIEQEVEVDRVDRVWVFPPRRIEAGETAVVVVAAYALLDDARRRVYAAHYTAPADATAPSLALDEYGTAPAERVGRLVEDVVERLEDPPTAAARPYRVEGEPDHWNAMLHELAESHLEEAARDPHLRP